MTAPHAAPNIAAADSAATVLRKRADCAEAHARVMREQVASYDESEALARSDEPLFAPSSSYADTVRWAPVFHAAHADGLRRLADGEPLEDVMRSMREWPGLDGYGDNCAEMLELIHRGVVRDHGPIEAAPRCLVAGHAMARTPEGHWTCGGGRVHGRCWSAAREASA